MGKVFKSFFYSSGIAILFFAGFFPFYAVLSKQVSDVQTAAYFSWMTPVMIWWNVKMWPEMFKSFSERLKK